MDVISAYVYRVTFGHVHSIIADSALPSGIRSSTTMLLAVKRLRSFHLTVKYPQNDYADTAFRDFMYGDTE